MSIIVESKPLDAHAIQQQAPNTSDLSSGAVSQAPKESGHDPKWLHLLENMSKYLKMGRRTHGTVQPLNLHRMASTKLNKLRLVKDQSGIRGHTINTEYVTGKVKPKTDAKADD